MNDVTWYFWSETLPNWIMALSALSALALFFWRRQDRLEAHIAQTTNIENSMNAVWVLAKVDGDDRDRWGVLVTNMLQTPVACLEVSCRGNSNSDSLAHPNLQPGKHFFESAPPMSPRAWLLPTMNISSFEYITASNRHSTRHMSFTYQGNKYSKSLSSD